jgi:hypothetical protein
VIGATYLNDILGIQETKDDDEDAILDFVDVGSGGRHQLLLVKSFYKPFPKPQLRVHNVIVMPYPP